MPYEEQPLSMRGRLIVAALAWVPGAAAVWWLVGILGWWSLPVVALAAWATWDYLRKGRMFESVDGVSRAGAWIPRGIGIRRHDD